MTCPEAVTEADALLVNKNTGVGFRLVPLIFFHPSRLSSTIMDCVMLDGLSRDGRIEYKVVGRPESLAIDRPEFGGLAGMVEGLFDGSTLLQPIGDCRIEEEI